MNTRTLATAILVLGVSFGVPVIAFAQSSPASGSSGTSGSSLGSGVNTPVGSSLGQPSNIVTLINPLQGMDCSSGNGNCLASFLNSILDFVITIGSIIVILMLVYVGYLFVVARGNDSKITEARQALLWTVIGALVLLGAKAIAIGVCETVKSITGSTGACF